MLFILLLIGRAMSSESGSFSECVSNPTTHSVSSSSLSSDVGSNGEWRQEIVLSILSHLRPIQVIASCYTNGDQS